MPEGQTENVDLSSAKVMQRAIAIQADAARFGFDWSTLPPIFEKLLEEIQELKAECELADQLASKNKAAIQDELGDVLFCCMNLARFLQVDPASALESTNRKFERRFNFIREQVALSKREMSDLSLEELDRIWEQAKREGL